MDCRSPGRLSAWRWHLRRLPAWDSICRGRRRPTNSIEQISRSTDADDVDSMREVEREINEFVARFPDDERTAELRAVPAADRARQDESPAAASGHRGGIADPSLLPVEVLYLEAMNAAESSPESAVGMLESLVKLYGGRANASDSIRTSVARDVRPTGRTAIGALREDLAETDGPPACSHPRAARGGRRARASEHPDQARDDLPAILDLYGDRAWAADVVAEARQKLDANLTQFQ